MTVPDGPDMVSRSLTMIAAPGALGPVFPAASSSRLVPREPTLRDEGTGRRAPAEPEVTFWPGYQFYGRPT